MTAARNVFMTDFSTQTTAMLSHKAEFAYTRF